MPLILLLVTADPGFRALLRSVLEVALKLRVADTHDWEEAARLARQLPAAVLVADLALASTGLTAMRRIKAEQPNTRVIVLTSDGKASLGEALQGEVDLIMDTATLVSRLLSTIW